MMMFRKQNNMNLKLIFGLMVVLLAACTNAPTKITQEKRTTDPNVKSQLQGVWLDRNTESPVLKFDGDSLLFASKSDVLMPYLVADDTLFVCGVRTVPYQILERTEHSLSIKTPMGDEVSLYKDEQGAITIEQPAYAATAPISSVIKKDKVIMCGNTRYHGYVTINPTSIKVVRPGVTEDGFNVDNVYYDNIIHICVYKGKEEMCGKDIKRAMFEGVVPSEFLSVSILEDMSFQGVKDNRFLFRAVLRVPDGPSYYSQVLIDTDNKVETSLI